jgi:hypothetical protein
MQDRYHAPAGGVKAARGRRPSLCGPDGAPASGDRVRVEIIKAMTSVLEDLTDAATAGARWPP